MNLFIVESPAKAKTIKQYLGANFTVLASFGHIRELVKKDGSVDVNNNFELKYQDIPSAKAHIKALVDAAKNSDKIYLASDPDREGEAISQAVYDLLIKRKSAKPEQFYRVTYTEITKKAVEEAVANPRKIDKNLVDAQQARLALDYLVGFNLSPVLWRKLPGSKSAGRVQSVALRMIVDREFEIKAFKPEEYWTISAILNSVKNSLESRVIKYNNQTFDVNYPKNEQTADEICDFLKKCGEVKVVKNEEKDVKQNPYPPYTTSLLQQDAVHKLGFSSKKTMQLAQRLYEGVQIGGKTIALITYMRTDGMTLSNDALAGIRKQILADFGEKYLPPKAIVYKTKAKNAQEAHEAIRPTHIEITPSSIKNDIDYDMWKLYDIIWKRTMACQMNSAIISRKTIDFIASNGTNEALARVNGSQIKFNGHLSVYHIGVDEDEKQADGETLLPDIKVGDVLKIEKTKKDQHFTMPPARYNEATLVKNLESYGIGRPSTYATIISVLQERNYVVLQKKQFTPTPLGSIVAEFLKKYFSQYVQYDFTAKLENELDLISDNKLDYVGFLKAFWKDFKSNVDSTMNIEIGDIFKYLNDLMTPYFFGSNELKCSKCGSKMVLKSGRYGAFFGCSNYPTCKNMQGLDGEIITSKDESGAVVSNVADLSFDSEKFGKITIKSGRYGRYAQFNEGEKVKNAKIPEKIELDLKTVEFYCSLPLKIGVYDDVAVGGDVFIGLGFYGPYILHNKRYYTYTKKPLNECTIEDACERIRVSINKPKKTFTRKKTEKKTEKEGKKTTKKTTKKTKKS